MNEDISIYLSGEKLYGDDFTSEQIEEWFNDEKEGYADLGAREKIKYQYGYYQLNNYHGFKFLCKRRIFEALGIGSAYGEEFKPIANMIERITILDPSDAFSKVFEINGTTCRYKKPNADGSIPVDNNYFDLITSFGVMHHIPNVTYVMSECYRCLNKGGVMLLREPITSLGNWTKPRYGLTKRERGIPIDIFDKIISNSGFKVKHRSLCIFSLIPKLANKFGVQAYNNYLLTISDAILSKIFSFNTRYHRVKTYEKIGPASVFFVLEK